MPFPYGNMVDVWVFLSSQTTDANDAGAWSLEAHADGKGIMVWSFSLTANTSVYFKLTANASPVIDTTVTVRTPGYTSDPNHTILTICRRGVIAGGLDAATGDWSTSTSAERLLGDPSAHGIYCPPGFTLNCINTLKTATTACAADIKFTEFLDTQV